MRKWISGLALGLTLTACSTVHNPLDYRHWQDETTHRNVAADAYLYAQLAYNAYAPTDEKPPHFNLDGVFTRVAPAPDNDEIGLAYTVYTRTEGACAPEVVVVFRGTEGVTNFPDMWHGNALGRQNTAGLEEFRKWVRWRNDNLPGARMTVVGHSLGGGIATYISINEDDVASFAFDGSPRYWRLDRSLRRVNIRHQVAETGEILFWARAVMPPTDQLYTPFNCTWSWKPITQHDMHTLAVCLTTVAAWESDEAERSLRVNNLPAPVLIRPRPAPQRPSCGDVADARPLPDDLSSTTP